MAVPLEIGSLLILSCPIFGAFFALLLLLLDTSDTKGEVHRENHILMAYFLLVILNLGQIVSLYFNAEVYVWTSALGLLSYGWMQVFFYWFVFELTRMDFEERFSWIHFVFPVVFSTILFGYMGNVYGVKLLFGLVYLAFNYFRLIQYNRFIRNYSANEEKASLRWLWFLLVVSVIALPFPLVWIFMKSRMMLSLGAIIMYSLLMFFLYVYLTLHVIRKDRFRVILGPEIEESHAISTSMNEEPGISKKSVLKKELFEEYIQHRKPYLNQDLRITDMVDVFHVNRTYISSFINVEYNMHFSTYINSHRMKEYLRLSKMPENRNASKQELVERAGFNSYRSFLRIKKEVRD